MRKLRDIKLVTTERKNCLVSEHIYHTTNFFTENLLAMEMKKGRYLWINEFSYEFWYDYVKPKYGEKPELCWMYKTDNIYKDISEDTETRFDTSNCKLDRPIHGGKNKIVSE